MFSTNEWCRAASGTVTEARSWWPSSRWLTESSGNAGGRGEDTSGQRCNQLKRLLCNAWNTLIQCTSLSWLLFNTDYIIQTTCDCEIDFWGALPHKHPLSALKSGPAEGTGTHSSWHPCQINTFLSFCQGRFSLKKEKKIAKRNSAWHAGYTTGCFKQSDAQRAQKNSVLLQGYFKWYISVVKS